MGSGWGLRELSSRPCDVGRGTHALRYRARTGPTVECSVSPPRHAVEMPPPPLTLPTQRDVIPDRHIGQCMRYAINAPVNCIYISM